jgi:hypothetical protein
MRRQVPALRPVRMTDTSTPQPTDPLRTVITADRAARIADSRLLEYSLAAPRP